MGRKTNDRTNERTAREGILPTSLSLDDAPVPVDADDDAEAATFCVPCLVPACAPFPFTPAVLGRLFSFAAAALLDRIVLPLTARD